MGVAAARIREVRLVNLGPPVARALAAAGYRALPADSLEALLESLAESPSACVIAGVAGAEAATVARRVRAVSADQPLIAILTASSAAERAAGARAARLGRYRVLFPPVEPELLLCAVEDELERRTVEEELEHLRERCVETERVGELVARAPAMRAALSLARRVASRSCGVLLEGEPATGRKTLARGIHALGGGIHALGGGIHALGGAARPLRVVRCRTADETELLTAFDEARGGTLLLEELGELRGGPAAVLEELLDRSDRSAQAAPRVLATAAEHLDRACAAGRFSRGLFDRIAVVRIALPPLRDRAEDVPHLARALLARRTPRDQRRALSHSAEEALASQRWPGNLRELESALERGLALSDEAVLGPEAFALSEAFGSSGAFASAGSGVAAEGGDWLQALARERLSLRDVQERYIDAVLTLAGGHRGRAAAVLGIDRKTLYLRRRARGAGRRGELL